MKRVKHHKIKKEKAECSNQQRVQEEHDLAYYIHDRVELMHQVFSILKYKELKTMAPACVRNLAIGDLEELCTEELLGISSKRLLTILDGVEPPSDTESSSPSPPPEQLETISLDSISSDEALLSTNNKKKRHKHRHRGSKAKSKKKDKAKEPVALTEENSEVSKASRAGLTVLELLELQARARAIRAQLQKEQVNKRPSETIAAESSHHSSENEVEIKEEPADVVEISSEDEKPDVDKLKKNIAAKTTPPKVANTEPGKESEKTTQHPQTVTKRINNLIITVPQAVPTRKIRLNRNKVTVSTTNNPAPTETRSVAVAAPVAKKTINNPKNTPEKSVENKPKKKKKDKKKKTVDKDGSDHDEITLQLSDSEKMDLLEDLDESRKNYERVSSSSEDTESSSSDSDDDNISDKTSKPVATKLQKKNQEKDKNKCDTYIETIAPPQNDQSLPKNAAVEISPPIQILKSTLIDNIDEIDNSCTDMKEDNVPKTIADVQLQQISNVNPNENITSNLIEEKQKIVSETKDDSEKRSPRDKTNDDAEKLRPGDKTNGDAEDLSSKDKTLDKVTENISSEDKANDQETNKILLNETTDLCTEQIVLSHKTLLVTTSSNDSRSVAVDTCFGKEIKSSNIDSSSSETLLNDEKVLEITSIEDIPVLSDCPINSNNIESQRVSENNQLTKETEQRMADGELSDHQSSEVEAVDVQPEVVCISDEESPKKKLDKKKKKKEKKTKKEKKSKKTKSDFREDSDQNFYKDANTVSNFNSQNVTKSLTNESTTTICDNEPIDLDSDDVYEYLELSDDSSCYEVEGTVLSKEPTAEEIEALSAKIDEIEREDVVTDEQIRKHENVTAEKETNVPDEETMEHISWKDRYLDSNKVKKVLTTANIFNALRKKNRELKKKIQESKKTEEKETSIEEDVPKENVQLEEGSIEQYNALEGSTKYVDPVTETTEENKHPNESNEQAEKLVTVPDETDVTRQMKKDAKQLLKMYRRLLKHNDMNRQKDPNKKKKKKQKKKDKQNLEHNIAQVNGST